MPKKLNIIFDAQNDAQEFGVPYGRGCFLRYLMRADSAQRVVGCSVISGIDLDGFALVLRAMWRASFPVLSNLLLREVAAAGHQGGCVCLGDMAGLEDQRLKQLG